MDWIGSIMENVSNPRDWVMCGLELRSTNKVGEMEWEGEVVWIPKRDSTMVCR
jgi:hypothetical protein